jgi:hypothetical protein
VLELLLPLCVPAALLRLITARVRGVCHRGIVCQNALERWRDIERWGGMEK